MRFYYFCALGQELLSHLSITKQSNGYRFLTMVFCKKIVRL